ncbi:hemolysin III family channel protein [Spizellomyces punctatus DAOM BR117]|uniref:Hemolysin III family channel protein n=1 Tax=Spizellomyces punctatus (strain DAOM BR117) TaxID=645134 RepID=A0A0L0HNV3_SPIPD|nr:hemolysin III family channel protein [Spizellomyces punctatus DAOM BR117]KND02504.1 hemolysin III family channel protein [Spizellomyces punctatus DAOM BR117]|eukprot:XP_016610543.1 hemolysin III family channel protein [Spizellomyces punctatus DAOM BR117]
MSPKQTAHITAVLDDSLRSATSVEVSSYEQRIGAARRRQSLKADPSAESTPLLDKAATDPVNVPATSSAVLRDLRDYDQFTQREGEPNKYTVPIKEMPDWYVDNVYLLKGYRRITNSYLGCVKSLTYLHNETGNVFTHALGFVGFVVLAQVFYGWLTVETSTWADILIISMFFLGAVVCLGLSTTFHLCCCHSRSVAAVWLRGDYVGIVTLIMGSFVPSIYYGFFCSPKLQAVYLAVIVIFGIVTICITVSPKFFAPRYRLLRTGLFVLMGLTGVVPLVHALTKYGSQMTRHALSSGSLISSGAIYFLGAVVYACRVPERWAPGKFDLWFHSHQIFHCLVVAAAVVHYYGVVEAYRWWHTYNLQCSMDPEAVIRKMMTSLHFA